MVKKNIKGFTLIELLAVIVILAIIALIATPTVLNIIDKARVSAAADSIYGVMESMRLAYAESLLEADPLELPITVDFANGKILEGTSASDSGKTLTLSGSMPTAGTITLASNGNFSDTTGVIVNTKSCNITSSKVVCQ